MFTAEWLLLSRVSSSHLPPNFNDVGKRSMKGRTQRALSRPVHFSVTHVRSSFVMRVPPSRTLVLTKLRGSNQSLPEVCRMTHWCERGLVRVAVQLLGTPPPSLLENPRSIAS